MIIFTTRNYNGPSLEYAENCVEKYCTLSRLSKLPPIPKEKRPKVIKDEMGKPYAEGIYISISHSGETLTVAVSDRQVGIDIEKVKPINWERLMHRYFTEEEIKSIKSVKDFYCKWTQKEAFFKALSDQRGVFAPAINTVISKNLSTYEIYDNIVLSVFTEDRNVYFYT